MEKEWLCSDFAFASELITERALQYSQENSVLLCIKNSGDQNSLKLNKYLSYETEKEGKL